MNYINQNKIKFQNLSKHFTQIFKTIFNNKNNKISNKIRTIFNSKLYHLSQFRIQI